MSDSPFVSVIIPCRNEIKHISGLLECVVNQDYPKNKLEIIIADALSDDGTREVINNYIGKYPYIKLVDNDRKIIPVALNKAINKSKGDILIRLDAHSEYPKNYFSKLVEVIEKTGADDVGAMWDTQPGDTSLKAKAIAMAMSNSFGVGSATYRTSVEQTEPFEVDTVPFGCYKKSVFEKIGLYDETMLCNEDNDFNDRLRKAGGKILLIPTLKIRYYARENYTKLWKMFWRYSFYMPYVNQKLGIRTRLSRYVPSAFALSLIIPTILGTKFKRLNYLSLLSLIAYFIASTIVAFKACKGNILLMFFTIAAFIVSHLAYGLGYLCGWFYFCVLNKKPPQTIGINR